MANRPGALAEHDVRFWHADQRRILDVLLDPLQGWYGDACVLRFARPAGLQVTRIFAAEVVSDVGAAHGECPTWHPADRSLVWVDIGAGQVHRFDPSTGADEAFSVGSQLGSVAPRSAGGLVLAIEEGFALLDSFDSEPRLVASVDHGPGPVTRMNDGKCDPYGRFWAGSMAYDCAPSHGALYRLNPDLRVSKVLDGVTISNGLDWSHDGRTLFYIDTLAGASFWDVIVGTVRPGVDAFDIHPDSGSPSRRRRLFDVPAEQSVPTGMALADGMTIDAEGSLWVAVHGAGQVRRYSLNGDIEAVVELPVACPTSVAFGGEDFGDLYITSMTPHGAPGRDPRTPALMWDPRPFEGALFRCRPGVAGRSPHVFRG